MISKKYSFPGVLSEQYKSDPYFHIELLNKKDNIIYDKTLKAYLAVSYDAVQYVLNSSDIFSTKPLAERAEPVMRGKVLAQMEGEEHKVKRKIILRQITGNVLRNYYEPILHNLCDSILKNIMRKETFDFISEFGSKYALLTTFNIIGINFNELNYILDRLKIIVLFATGFNISEHVRKEALKASEELEKIILRLIHERRSGLGNDIISFIIKESNTEKIITDSEIVALSLNILLAASEPVDKVLANCIYHLFRNRGFITRLIDGECSYNNVLQETLRITPPVHLIPRMIERDNSFEGINLTKGDLIYSLIPSANRDDSYFENPNTFDPHRKYKGHLSYGSGIHACIGAQFANSQLNIAIKKLMPILQNYKEVIPPSFEGIYTRGVKEYYLERV
ncbi:TPA: cytochrome P450 [Salmonella enterica]|uniref:Cytochrome P450 n=1 Tax=Salmonella enterica TaxID=28901 RepID=A0A757VV93_SALER|nr:cytochrome P450 [Salmonella enterica]